MLSDPIQAERFLRWAFAPGDLFEVRGVASSAGTLRGLFEGNYEQAAKDACEMADSYGAQVFYSLNPVDPNSDYARSTVRKTVANAKRTLGAASVLRRRHLLLDFDPDRPAGTASAPEHLEAARVAAAAASRHLSELGWPEPLAGLSGNGVHLLFRLDGEPLESGAVKAALQYLSLAVETPGVVLDASVFDPARVARLFGTVNGKVPGDPRETRVLGYPGGTVVVPAAKVAELAALRGYRAAARSDADEAESGLSEDDVLEFIHEYRRDLPLGSAERRDGDSYFHLRQCPVVQRKHAGHNDRSVSLRLRDGRLQFVCMAEKCREITFRRMAGMLAERRGRNPSNPSILAATPASPVDTEGWEIDDGGSEAATTLAASAPALAKSLRPVPAAAPSAPMAARPRLYLDFEVRSELDIRVCGATKYLAHGSTKPLWLAYAYDDGPVELIDLAGGSGPPAQLLADLASPEWEKVAWNAGFEFSVVHSFFGVEVDLRHWFDAATLSRYLTHSASLSGACRDLGLAPEEGKATDGRDLIRLFSTPQKAPSKRIEAGEPPTYWAGEAARPEEWLRFGEYCRQDVASMRTALAKLESHGRMPRAEHRIWRLDQEINLRGIPVDLEYVRRAGALLGASDAAIRKRIQELTGLANPNSGKQMRAWLSARGAPMESLDEEHVAEALGAGELPEAVAEVLRLKQRLSGAGPKKLAAIEARVFDDHRLYNELFYYSAHTGRWAGRGVQVHNLPKPGKDIKPRVVEITAAIRAGAALPDGLDVRSAVTGTVRSSIRPPDGRMLVASDFNAIENRILAYAAECPRMLGIYAKGLDPYQSFAVVLYRKPYAEVSAEERNNCKATVLAAGFGLGWRGLQVQALKYGLRMSDATAQKHINLFRSTYAEVPVLWRDLMSAVFRAMRRREVVACRCFRLDAADARFLRMELPSGRSLYYRGARLRQEPGEDSPCLVYRDATGEKRTYGGKLVENAVQAIARDLLCDALLACEREELRTIMHVHDEIVVEVDAQRAEEAKAKMEEIMSRTPAWCAGLPLAAKASVLEFYRKD